jgi:hypothetical protein
LIRVTKIAPLSALVASLSLACFAHHAGTPLELEPAGTPTDHERKLVVGVRKPEVKLDPPIVEGAKAEPSTSLVHLDRSLSLIRSMRASGLYREVDFEGQLACAPDLVIEVHDNPQLGTCDADAPMALLYLGIIPVWYTCDGGHYFSRVDGETQRFEFPWHETRLFGWFMPFLNLLPGWTRRPPPPGRLYDTFRAFLLSHASELLPETRSDGPSACPSG